MEPSFFEKITPTCCTDLSKKTEKLVNSQIFERIILLFIILNTIILAAESYEEPEWLTSLSYNSNIVLTAIFTLEMLLKLFGLGIKQYVKDNFNLFDSIVVILSLIDLALDRE